MLSPTIRRSLLAALVCALPVLAAAQTVEPSLLNGLRYRLIGPFRGGRSLAVAGVPGMPEKFYFGAVGGGVWQTENAGRTWTPIFDSEPVASIGAIAVAPSNPEVIYVGTGEADMRSDIQQGNGMYRSSDAGRTWKHIGLADTRQIGKILIDPKDTNVVYVAALGHQYGPNEQRGVFKTTDGGKTWSKVLYKNPDVGVIDMDMDPSDSNVIFASMWQTRRPPWSVYPPSNGPGSGLYKTTDAGMSWTQVQGNGFPANVGHVGISISPADHNRIYVCADTVDPKAGGVFRSNDGGATWTHTSGDTRVWGRGWYFCGITADPKNADCVYVMNTSAYRSYDGGKIFTAFKGAPGGDDYHTCWIYPNDSHRLILASDQGTIVSVDNGKTWSSWYNQPTGQFYHVIADNRFPYWVYGSQQDSGAMAVPSRTIHTGISALYQRPIDAGGESGTIAPDPLHPGMLFSSTGIKESIETAGQQSIEPTLGQIDESWRNEWTMPIVVSPVDPHVLYTSHQKIFRSGDSGASWKIISPDLTRETPGVLPNLDAPTVADHEGFARRGVVYWIAPSPVKAKTIWAGTDDGLIWLTSDEGAHWKNVTPALSPWSKVGIIDASHFDANTAYAAVDRHRIDDNHPYIYRTHDGGKHWTLIGNGIPKSQFVNVVREDPKKAGLLYAGTDWGVFVSFDDGAHWQSLQLNLPAASVRDIVFAGNDVIVGTHGRAIWILDDASRLRQMTSPPWRATHDGVRADSRLFSPAPAIQFQRAGTFGFGAFDEGTPLPPEEPQGENPAWGAVLDYSVGGAMSVVLTVTDASGRLMRRLSSSDKAPEIDPSRLSIPAYWVRPPQELSSATGGHRYVWDLRYLSASGPIVPPGTYSLELTVINAGTSFFHDHRSLTVVRDPRVGATDADLRAQFKLVLEVESEIKKVATAQTRAQAMLQRKLTPAQRTHMLAIIGGGGRRRGAGPRSGLSAIAAGLAALDGAVQVGPGAPTLGELNAFATLRQRVDAVVAELNAIGVER